MRGNRLEMVGIRTASELVSLCKRMGRSGFESFLDNICGQNSRWTGMTIAALNEYNETIVPFVDLNQSKKIISTANAPLMATVSSIALDEVRIYCKE